MSSGTGQAGGEGITKVARVTYLDMIRGLPTGQDPKQVLFFTRTPAGIRAGKDFLLRITERSEDRDKKITVACPAGPVESAAPVGCEEPCGPLKGSPPRPRRKRRQ